MSLPTFAQEDYAQALVQRLQQANLLEGQTYAKRVMRCQDRQQMSQLIDQMKRLVEQAEQEP